MIKDKSELIEALKSLFLRGCTSSELIRMLREKCPGVDTTELASLVTDAFGVSAGYFGAITASKQSLDTAILNASILTEFVAKRELWDVGSERATCWMDSVYVEYPQSDDEHEDSIGISSEGWTSLSKEDRARLKTMDSTMQLLSYRCAVLAVLCEQLQSLLNSE